MRLFLAGAGAKSSPRCLASATTNTFRNVSPSPPPPPLHLPFHPSKPPANNLRLLSTLHERKANYVPSAFSKGLERGGGGGEALPSERKLAVVAWSAVTLVVAMANRVLQKLALVPMKDYPFFLTQLNIFV